MTTTGPILSALDAVLARARDLLMDFDGVICRLYDPTARERTADYLRTRLADPATGYDGPVPHLADPAVVLYSAKIEGLSGRNLESDLAGWEYTAITTALPVSSAPDVIAGARESGRTVTVVSSCAARVVDRYLDQAGLSELTGPAIGRKEGKPESGEPGAVLARCVRQHWPHRSTCAVVSAHPDVLNAAREAHIPAIRYHGETGQPAWLPGLPSVTLTSLHPLVKWFRTRPLPSS